jgi:hypothetical protein
MYDVFIQITDYSQNKRRYAPFILQNINYGVVRLDPVFLIRIGM